VLEHPESEGAQLHLDPEGVPAQAHRVTLDPPRRPVRSHGEQDLEAVVGLTDDDEHERAAHLVGPVEDAGGVCRGRVGEHRDRGPERLGHHHQVVVGVVGPGGGGRRRPGLGRRDRPARRGGRARVDRGIPAGAPGEERGHGGDGEGESRGRAPTRGGAGAGHAGITRTAK